MSVPVWLVTGARSGFGAAVAKEALARGHRVIATARRSSSLGALAAAGATVMDLDVTSSDADLDAKFAEAAAVYGTITHVINCAGYALEGAVEEASEAESAAQYRTNVLGAVNVTRAAVPHLRSAASLSPQTKPVIAHFGSLGSWIGTAAVAHYCSTKWAVSGLTEGIAHEVASFGIAACVIEPGYFRTEFLNTRSTGEANDHRIRVAAPLDSVYAGTPVEQYKKDLDRYNNLQPGDVAKGAKVIVDVLTQTGVGKGRDIPIRLVLGSDCVDTIREKCEATLRLLQEWEDVARSTDYE